MSTTTSTVTGPGRALGVTFRALRLPLTAVETVTRHRGSEWPPAIAFMRIEGSVFQAAGGVFRSDQLTAEGRRLQAAATKAARAIELDAEAELAEQQAERERRERIERAEQLQQRASEAADEKREHAAEVADEKRRKAAARTAAAKEDARKRDEATAESLRKRQRADNLAAAKEEAEALGSKGSALNKKADVLDLDDKIEQSRRIRKSSVS